MSRSAEITRTTKETDIAVELNLDGSGSSSADTGIPFFDHMLQQLGKHAGWDLDVTCKGDLQVDGHHTVEDCGIAIGTALAEALGDKAGIRRFASITVPLDEAAVEVALDLLRRFADASRLVTERATRPLELPPEREPADDDVRDPADDAGEKPHECDPEHHDPVLR